MNISKAIAYLSRDEVKAVKETAHVGIGVLGFHHVGHLVKVNNIYFDQLLYVSPQHLVAVEGGSKSASTHPSEDKLTDGFGPNHLLEIDQH